MCPKHLILIVVFALLCPVAAAAAPQADASCEDLPLSTVDRASVESVSGGPGDTVWAPVYLQTDSLVVGFILIIQYDHVLLSPLAASTPNDLLYELVGRMAGHTDFFLQRSQWALDSGAIIAGFGTTVPFLDTLTPGADAIFRIPFVVNPAAAPGDSAEFRFLRYTSYAIDSTSTPPDTTNIFCRGSQVALQYGADPNPVGSWPTTDTTYLHIEDQIPIIYSFSASPRSVYAGDQVWLGWQCDHFDSLVLSPGVGPVPGPFASAPVYPDTTTRYTLYAYRGPHVTDSSVLVYAVPDGANRYPWLSSVGPITVETDNPLNVWVYGVDPDGIPPILSTSALPGDASFYDDGLGDGNLTWTPGIADIGVYPIWIYATDREDASLVDSALLQLTVAVHNYPPQWDFNTQLVSLYERDTLQFTITTSDSNGVIPSITAHTTGGQPLAPNMTFVDSGNGVGVFTFIPDLFQGNTNPNLYYVGFTVRDGADSNLAVGTDLKSIRVYNRNSGQELPQIDISVDTPLSVTEGDSLIFEVNATTTIGDLPEITAGALPPGGSLTSAPGNITNDHKIFQYFPDFNQAGIRSATFIAANADLVDSLTVDITVLQGNQPPLLFVPPGQTDTVTEGGTLLRVVYGLDADSTVPSLSARLDGADSLATNMTFVDSGNGTGVLAFEPDQAQGSAPTPTFYYVKFRARDAVEPYPEATSGTYTFRVYDSGLPCCVGTVGDVDYSGSGADRPNVADLTRLVSYLFGSQGSLPCLAEADIDGGGVTVSDLTRLVGYIFGGGEPLPACP